MKKGEEGMRRKGKKERRERWKEVGNTTKKGERIEKKKNLEIK